MISNEKMTIIVNEKIKEEHDNGGRTKTVIFKNDKDEKFKITVHSESYASQSYAKLEKFTDKFNHIHSSNNIKRDYNIDISYKSQYNTNVFDVIINEYMTLAENF